MVELEQMHTPPFGKGHKAMGMQDTRKKRNK